MVDCDFDELSDHFQVLLEDFLLESLMNPICPLRMKIEQREEIQSEYLL